jgi:hypothetical protein
MLLDNRKTQVIEVEVTQEDIDKAETQRRYGRSSTCALAHALNRSTGSNGWMVGYTHALTGMSGDFYSHDGSDLVCAFDSGKPITGTVRLTRKAE